LQSLSFPKKNEDFDMNERAVNKTHPDVLKQASPAAIQPRDQSNLYFNNRQGETSRWPVRLINRNYHGDEIETGLAKRVF
jgi:hypothetical protein